MTDVAKISWFKAKLIVYIAGYLAKQSIDEQTIRGGIHAISEFFKDKDEKSVLRACSLLCTKVQSGINERFKELDQGVSMGRNPQEARWRSEREYRRH